MTLYPIHSIRHHINNCPHNFNHLIYRQNTSHTILLMIPHTMYFYSLNPSVTIHILKRFPHQHNHFLHPFDKTNIEPLMYTFFRTVLTFSYSLLTPSQSISNHPPPFRTYSISDEILNRLSDYC